MRYKRLSTNKKDSKNREREISAIGRPFQTGCQKQIPNSFSVLYVFT